MIARNDPNSSNYRLPGGHSFNPALACKMAGCRPSALLLVQVINQCCEESAGQRLAAAALLVTCRGWGSELRVRCQSFRTTAIGLVSFEEFSENSDRKENDAAKRMLWKKGLSEIHSISPSPRRLINKPKNQNHHDRNTQSL
jgi:hypothetical protein